MFIDIKVNNVIITNIFLKSEDIMEFKVINEKNSIEFVDSLLSYYSKIDAGSINTILTSNDLESKRNNVGWYQYVDNQYKIFINVPNMMYLKQAIDRGELDYQAYYAFLTLCVGHEFRHFLQGRCIYEGVEMDGYGQKDVVNAQLMLYIRYFFDAYYLLNKGYVKYEEDAEKFAIINGIKFLKNNFSSMDVEKAMVDAVRYYANIQSSGGIISTLPKSCSSVEEILSKIDIRIKENLRINDLNKTLFVHNPKCYGNHSYFGLDEDKLLCDTLVQKYSEINDGSKQDLLVASAIISILEKPVESLEEFPILKKKYLENK